jgi:hypothetical protein
LTVFENAIFTANQNIGEEALRAKKGNVMVEKRNYWGYRIDVSAIDFFWKELSEGRLRQGWGYDPGQNLRSLTVDEGASRNLAIFNNVKKGDILLIPRLPEWGYVAIAEATEDFDKGYRFEFGYGMEDYAHIFPVKYLRKFVRYAENVSGDIKTTLRSRSRFWSVSHLADDVNTILNSSRDEIELKKDAGYRFDAAINQAFSKVYSEADFACHVYDALNHRFTDTEWEYALVYGLAKLFPSYTIERTGGTTESSHGTDFLVRIPGILGGDDYGIAVQVKDHSGEANFTDNIAQISKADDFWARENIKIIDKYILYTKVSKEDALNIPEDTTVKFIFAKELKELLANIGKVILGLKLE